MYYSVYEGFCSILIINSLIVAKGCALMPVGDDGEMIVMHSLRDYDAEKSAGRMAVQAAAGALMSVTGHTCDDIVMCSSSREWDELLEVVSPTLLFHVHPGCTPSAEQ